MLEEYIHNSGLEDYTLQGQLKRASNRVVTHFGIMRVLDGPGYLDALRHHFDMEDAFHSISYGRLWEYNRIAIVGFSRPGIEYIGYPQVDGGSIDFTSIETSALAVLISESKKDVDSINLMTGTVIARTETSNSLSQTCYELSRKIQVFAHSLLGMTTKGTLSMQSWNDLYQKEDY